MIEKGIEPVNILERELEELPLTIKWLRQLREFFPRIRTYNPTINPTSVAANSTAEQTFTVTGLSANDIVSVNKPTHTSGLGIVGCRASANTLAITFANITGSPIDPPSETYLIKATRL